MVSWHAVAGTSACRKPSLATVWSEHENLHMSPRGSTGSHRQGRRSDQRPGVQMLELGSVIKGQSDKAISDTKKSKELAKSTAVLLTPQHAAVTEMQDTRLHVCPQEQ